ncbi:uncharacterized protein MELLADRAFT_113182 [Melampsora larici-populina 98AG31]|uniref:Uncharacterized protein n=1 Tax=Melampsora larici-populina (strain 98AG31 / pathotype 3-4-7) TaxID=747676 RepID=F4S913_MELLP|nr:uncharacterized protein MELLADRAFT_113182 [Melampsora larici-populina 98AG31]EGF98866.1 hypothetical protein MELLADRAFT_113182 [Melampsora larici-populina 98AG31]
MSFQGMLDQTNNQLNQDQTEPNLEQALDTPTGGNEIHRMENKIIKSKIRVLTRAEAEAKGIQPSSRLLTPKRGATGRITADRSNGSKPRNLQGIGIPKRSQRPIGIKRSRGVGKQQKKKKTERKQAEVVNEEGHQSEEQETEEWGGIEDVEMDVGGEEGLKSTNEEDQFELLQYSHS